MRTVHCFHCGSDDIEFKADILVGCCEHKSGEVWHCNQCGEEMAIQVVYSDDPAKVDCPHEGEDHGRGACGACHGCDRNSTQA